MKLLRYITDMQCMESFVLWSLMVGLPEASTIWVLPPQFFVSVRIEVAKMKLLRYITDMFILFAVACTCLHLISTVITVPSQAPNSQPNPSPSDLRRAYEALGIASSNTGAPSLMPPAPGGVNRPHRLTGIPVGSLQPNPAVGPGGSVRVLPPPHPQGRHWHYFLSL
jgi:hypothetical protein